MSGKFERLLIIVVIALLGAMGARAEVIVSAPVAGLGIGETGHFDILLTNEGIRSLGIGAFSFDIVAGSPALNFVGATTMTAAVPYIFAGNSFDVSNGFPLATKTGVDLLASDAPDNGIAFVAGGGQTVSLGQVFFTIAPTATGPIAITFQVPGTSLSDLSGGAILPTLVNGEASITPAPLPIPLVAGSLLIFSLACGRLAARPRSTGN
jgi:hypothetical protein